MIRFKKSVFLGVAASVVLAGCSGNNNAQLSDLWTLNGQINTTTVTTVDPITQETAPSVQTIKILNQDGSGGTITVSVPANAYTQNGNSIALVQPGALFDNMVLASSGDIVAKGAGTSSYAPGTILVKRWADPDSAYQALTGVSVDGNGHVTGNYVALPRGEWDAKVVGPLAILDPNDSTRRLDIADGLYYIGFVNSNGQLAFPRKTTGVIAGDGETTLHLGVTSNFRITTADKSSSPFEGDITTLRVVKSNGDLVRTVNVNNGLAPYFNRLPTSNDPIPSTGVTSVVFTVEPTTGF